MRWLVDEEQDSERVAEIIRMAGGRVVGRTRLQKMVYLLDAAGFDHTFSFEYRHYGPYSEKLMRATSAANIEGIVREEEFPATWGGTYSVFSAGGSAPPGDTSETRLLQIANDANPIDLELGATAIFLAKEGFPDAWAETIKRKPEKAHRIDSAKRLVSQLSALAVPVSLPDIGR